MGLMACGALPNPDMPFNSELTRFEQRFAFLGFMQQPVPLVHEQFCTAMDITGQYKIVMSVVASLCELMARQCLLHFSPVACCTLLHCIMTYPAL